MKPVCSAVHCVTPSAVEINGDLLCLSCAKDSLPDNYDSDHWCPAHQCATGEGDICAECERLGQRELDLCKRIHPHINDMWLRFYRNRAKPKSHHTLRAIAEDTWTLSREEGLLIAMQFGYAYCVAKPMIDEVHGKWDKSYEDHCRAELEQRIADGDAVVVEPLDIWHQPLCQHPTCGYNAVTGSKFCTMHKPMEQV